jgi:hypothetical protein
MAKIEAIAKEVLNVLFRVILVLFFPLTILFLILWIKRESNATKKEWIKRFPTMSINKNGEFCEIKKEELNGV